MAYEGGADGLTETQIQQKELEERVKVILHAFASGSAHHHSLLMHKNGEIDVRGCYTAIAVAHILDLLLPPVIDGVAEYISSCQTHEGGIGGEPGAEAHGGYTYCGLAALVLINQAHHLDLPALLNWAVFRQGNVEGGFQGRVNKLVDGCYSFWQGGIFPILQMLPEQLLSPRAVRRQDEEAILLLEELNTRAQYSRMANNAVSAAGLFQAIKDGRSKHVIYEINENSHPHDSSNHHTSFLADYKRGPLFNTQALQGYILLCCQVICYFYLQLLSVWSLHVDCKVNTSAIPISHIEGRMDSCSSKL
ncbi:hypothetical protein L7F22_001481 [Adiantum nelumboides]|nr:hypothetical protein [Adiantum nelumboides]